MHFFHFILLSMITCKRSFIVYAIYGTSQYNTEKMCFNMFRINQTFRKSGNYKGTQLWEVQVFTTL